MARMKGLGIISLVRLVKRLARDQGIMDPEKELGLAYRGRPPGFAGEAANV